MINVGQWKYSVWYYSDWYMTLHIYLNTQEEQTPRVNPDVNYECWVIITCQCKFINYNKCPTPGSDVDNGEGCACMGARSILELFVSSSEFGYKPKTALEQ